MFRCFFNVNNNYDVAITLYYIIGTKHWYFRNRLLLTLKTLLALILNNESITKRTSVIRNVNNNYGEIIKLRGHPHMASDDFGSFLTYLPSLIRYHQMGADLPTYPNV